jgi:hypothetical protein
LLISGWTAAGRLRRFGFWFALALAGQAVALQMINAGSTLHYQHYKSLSQIVADNDALFLAAIGVQAIAVAPALTRRWRAIWAWLRCSFRPWQLVAMGLVFCLPVAAVSERVSFYIGELLFAAFLQTLNLATVILAAWSLPASVVAKLREGIERLIGPADLAPAKVDRFALTTAAGVTLLAGALSFFVYQRHPHIIDEVAYLLQARFLASGHLTLPAPPVPDAFGFYLMEFRGDQWYSVMPPGWPAVLAIGVRLGIPWLVNPLLAGLNVLLAYLFIQEIYDRRSARMVVLLLCASPWFVFMGMNFMNHTLTLTCALAAALGVARARKTGRAVWAALAGVMVGIISIIRPLDGLIVGVLAGLWALGVGGRRLSARAIVAFALGTLLLGAAVLPYNKALTGSSITFPLNAYFDEHFGHGTNDYGFGPNRGFGWALDPNPGHSPVDGLINANLNTFSLNTELFGWSTGSLLMIALAVFAGARPRGDSRRRRSDYLMIATLGVIFVAFFFYYYSGGPDFGARYWYLMILPCVALTVRGMDVLQRKLESGAEGPTDRRPDTRVALAVSVLCLMTLINYFPWRAVDKYYHLWGMRPDVRTLATECNFGRSLVLIRGESQTDYTSAAIYNPLDLHADAPVYAWDRDPEVRSAVINAYRDRPIWLVDGPSITRANYEIIAGPLSANEALTR